MNPRTLGRIALPLIVAGLISSSCVKDTPDSSVTFSGPNASARPESREGGLLDFSAPKLGGGQVEGGDLEGKDVAIWFWAPW